MEHVNSWVRLGISRIEDLSDAVLHAGLESTQMGQGCINGSLAFTTYNNITYSSGLIQGRVALRGPLSQSLITLGVGLCIGNGSKHWLNEVTTGDIGVFHAGDDHDALYTAGSMYAAMSLSAEQLEEAAAKFDLILDAKTLGGTGFHPRQISPHIIQPMRFLMAKIHAGETLSENNTLVLNKLLLSNTIAHYARQPYSVAGRTKPIGLAMIVAKARDYFEANLHDEISIETATVVCGTSRRTLFRAFNAVLGESPQAYVKRRRLHCIRKELFSNNCSVSFAANQWGISEHGRMSGEYREMFSELPSQTQLRKEECEYDF